MCLVLLISDDSDEPGQLFQGQSEGPQAQRGTNGCFPKLLAYINCGGFVILDF